MTLVSHSQRGVALHKVGGTPFLSFSAPEQYFLSLHKTGVTSFLVAENTEASEGEAARGYAIGDNEGERL